MQQEPELAVATLVHGVVSDLLHQHKYAYAHFPEFVDLTVIATGLGTLLSNLDFVSQSPTFWDSTQWRLIPRPFLDSQGVAYANAIAAWTRGERDPEWATDLEAELQRSMTKSLKFLNKTDDCFFQPKRPMRNCCSSRSKSGWRWLKANLNLNRSSPFAICEKTRLYLRRLNRSWPTNFAQPTTA